MSGSKHRFGLLRFLPPDTEALEASGSIRAVASGSEGSAHLPRRHGHGGLLPLSALTEMGRWAVGGAACLGAHPSPMWTVPYLRAWICFIANNA